MEKVSVIVDSKIVNNYTEESKRPYCWCFTLNYLLDNEIKEVDIKYNGDIIYNVGNVVLFDIDSNNILDIDKLFNEDVFELEVIKEVYVKKYNKVFYDLEIDDLKKDTVEEKMNKHGLRVNASLEMDKLNRLLEKLDKDIVDKRSSKLK